MTLDQLTENAAEHARRILVDRPEATLLPTFLIQGRDRLSIVGTPFDGELEKDIVADAIRFTLKMEHANSYSFMSEAWMITQALDEPYIQPAKSDRRREVVIIVAVSRDGDGRMRTYEIKRNDKGIVTELTPDKDEVGLEGGRFSNLFEDD
jgi:hypothetical protein